MQLKTKAVHLFLLSSRRLFTVATTIFHTLKTYSNFIFPISRRQPFKHSTKKSKKVKGNVVTKSVNKIWKVAPTLPTTHLFRLQKAIPENTPASFRQRIPTIVSFIHNFPHRFDFYNSLKTLYMYLETYFSSIIEIKQQKNLLFFSFLIEFPFFFFMSLSWMDSLRRGSSNFRVELQERGCVHDNNLSL